MRLDVDPSGRPLDPHLAAGEDAVDPALAPERRPVAAVHLEPGRRELEVVGLRERDEHGLMFSSCNARVP
ncbi:MAG TPA: hypothetical protein VLS46_03365, partial [Gaiellaceae bacterium]|nr:hypothetical protein [Gaiellaceae bacterium]